VKVWGCLAKFGSTYASDNMYIRLYVLYMFYTRYILGKYTPWNNPTAGLQVCRTRVQSRETDGRAELNQFQESR
jgi:hypothetical protein